MRDFAKAFIVISGFLLAFACGWLTPTLEFSRAIMATVLFGSPLVVAWAMLCRDKPIRWHEYISFTAATLTIQGVMVLVVCSLFNAGLHKKLQFERNFDVFQKQLKNNPEYANIQSYYQPRKGGSVSLKGEVKDKESYDRLTLLLQGFLLCQDLGIGYGDHVEYPDKPKREEKRQIQRNVNEYRHESSASQIMREFFSGWKRKAGIVTLIMACGCMGLWIFTLFSRNSP